jgi:hypothetical protein
LAVTAMLPEFGFGGVAGAACDAAIAEDVSANLLSTTWRRPD